MAPRPILAAGLTLAALSVPFAAVSGTPAASAQTQCPPGEAVDTFTAVCLPYLVPNSPSAGVTSIPGNPSLPAVDGIPCTGANTGECIGLSEEQQAAGPAPVPRSSVSSSP